MRYRSRMRARRLVFSFITSLTFVAACTSPNAPGPVDAGATDVGRDVGSDANVDAPAYDAPPPTDANLDTFAFPDAGTSDGGACIAAGACDPFSATSCGAMACRPSASGTMCLSVSATAVGLGMPCVHYADCLPGLVCLAASAGDSPRCTRMCPAGSVGRCDTGYSCSGVFGDACINLCRLLPVACNILAQDCASATDACALVRNPETRAPYTGCLPAGAQTEGMTCGGASGMCARGLICAGTTGTPHCQRVCDPAASPTSCSAAASCTGVVSAWNVHYCI